MLSTWYIRCKEAGLVGRSQSINTTSGNLLAVNTIVIISLSLTSPCPLRTAAGCSEGLIESNLKTASFMEQHRPERNGATPALRVT